MGPFKSIDLVFFSAINREPGSATTLPLGSLFFRCRSGRGGAGRRTPRSGRGPDLDQGLVPDSLRAVLHREPVQAGRAHARAHRTLWHCQDLRRPVRGPLVEGSVSGTTSSYDTVFFSVADPECSSRIRSSRILVPNFFDPGSRTFIKEFKYFKPKKWCPRFGNLIRAVHPGSGCRILIFYSFRIPDPGVKKTPNPGSRSATMVFFVWIQQCCGSEMILGGGVVGGGSGSDFSDCVGSCTEMCESVGALRALRGKLSLYSWNNE